jgi:predicted LPLAT superfamily acyltransferase
MAASEERKRAWSGRSDGLPWMIRSLVALLKVVDRRFIYAVMALVVPFYMLFSHKGYLASYRFFRRRLGYGPLKSFFHVYGNHFCFGKIIIDRYAAYAGKKFRLINSEPDCFADLMRKEGGFVQLSSHAGSFEMTGYLLTSTKPVNGLVYAGETEVMMNYRSAIMGRHNIHLIRMDGSMTALFEMNAALNRGEVVSMTGDRLFGSNKGVKCRFFGEDALFPAGPFSLAAQKEVPLLTVFNMRERGGAYKLYEYRLEVDASLPARQRIQVMAQEFADRLEEVVRKYPHQWFNYYDFWKMPQ